VPSTGEVFLLAAFVGTHAHRLPFTFFLLAFPLIIRSEHQDEINFSSLARRSLMICCLLLRLFVLPVEIKSMLLQVTILLLSAAIQMN
jgi:hypothetical protein